MLTPDLLGLAEEMAAYYRAPIGTTLAAMLPPGLESRLVRRWRVADAAALPPELEGLADVEGLIPDSALVRRAPRARRSAWIERVRRSGAVVAEWSMRPPDISERRVRVVRAVRRIVLHLPRSHPEVTAWRQIGQRLGAA